MSWKMIPAISCKLSAIRREIFLVLISALLLVLSFPDANFWILAWIAFVPLLFALENKSPRKAFFLAYFTGIIFWAGTIYWLIHVTLPGTIILVLYLALYFGLFGLAYSLKLTAYSLPVIWVILEYIRSYLFTGFPWALLGYSQYLNLPVIQIADITGAWGVSFLIMMVNVAVYSALSYKLSAVSSKPKPILLVILVLFLTLAYGYFRIYSLQLKAYGLPLKVSVIQGNIPQELKWSPESNAYIIEKYLALSLRAAEEQPDLIIWPEAALPVVLEDEPRYFELVKDLSREIKIPLLLGAVTDREGLYYNSAILVSGSGRFLQRYDKLHLVPFGEYIPLKKIFSFLQTVVPIGDIERGKDYTVFAYSSQRLAAYSPTHFSVLICFEDLFPELSREFVKKGASFLVNITNDAWYKKTSAPWQHFQASVFRAVENRTYLVRSANTGVSGFIGPGGKIISLVRDKYGKNIFVDGYKMQKIPGVKRPLAFYTRFGDLFIMTCFLFTVYGIISRRKIKK